MSLKRLEVGPRMSQVVIHNKIAYLAGQVAMGAKGKSVGEQTQDILNAIDKHLKAAGTDKSKLITTNIWLVRHLQVRRDERGLGQVGVGRQYARPRHRRGQARRARVHRRDHGDGGD